MTKHSSEGLRNTIKKTKILNKERLDYLKNKTYKSSDDWQEFHSLKQVLKRPYKRKVKNVVERRKDNGK